MVDKSLEKQLNKFMRCNKCKECKHTFISYNIIDELEFHCLNCNRRWK